MNLSTPAEKKRIAIIGAGPGGLCAAMLLSTRGFDVTVFEKQCSVGGRRGALQLGEYTFDVGSTMLMMPFVLEELFKLAGRRLQDELALTQIEPMYQLHFRNRALNVYADAQRMEAELARFSPGEEFQLRRFLKNERHRLKSLYPVLQKDWPNLTSLISSSVLSALPYVGLTRSIYETAGDYFRDEDLKLAFSFQAAYLGMSPWDCPGGFEMVPYVEHAWGIFHVQGGIHKVCEAMQRVAEDAGAVIKTNAPVKRLMTEGERCTQVELENGERFLCDDAIINADAVQAIEQLLPRDISFRFSRKHLEHIKESCSTFMLYLGLDCVLPLPHHAFFFADDYHAEMNRVFKQGTLHQDFSIYLCNPSCTDPSLAPPGHSALYVLVLTPNTNADIDWKIEGPKMRNEIIRRLEAKTGLQLLPHIQTESFRTPVDWQNDFNISHAAVFGPAHNIGQLLAFRLPNQLPSPKNVFLTGGATNPGSGLPTILESARIVSRLICEKHQQPFPKSEELPTPTFGAMELVS